MKDFGQLRRQQHGKAGQDVAASALSRIGIERVRQIGTPVRLVASIQTPRGAYYKVVWGEKVAADHTGILPGGIFILAETKTRLDGNLVWSDFEEHQPGELSDHVTHGGVALVVWVHSEGVFILRWPIPGFGPGKGVKVDYARQRSIESIDELLSRPD